MVSLPNINSQEVQYVNINSDSQEFWEETVSWWNLNQKKQDNNEESWKTDRWNQQHSLILFVSLKHQNNVDPPPYRMAVLWTICWASALNSSKLLYFPSERLWKSNKTEEKSARRRKNKQQSVYLSADGWSTQSQSKGSLSIQHHNAHSQPV